MDPHGSRVVGGRETAMLTGGNAEVPPWYMATISLGMSVFFLCVRTLDAQIVSQGNRRSSDKRANEQASRSDNRKSIEETSHQAKSIINKGPGSRYFGRCFPALQYLQEDHCQSHRCKRNDNQGHPEFRIFGEMRPLKSRQHARTPTLNQKDRFQ